ncbi:MAG TPA: DUF1499 domain-containing protein [Xanthobacteraceae bacterium]|nr:DUF1499 domain-containing protein [Xanthobacteraceae bacterium]
MSMVMFRLRALEEPPSRLAVWARRIAVFSLAVAALAIIIERADLLEIIPVLVTFGAALVLAMLAILLAFASFVALWINGGPGFAQAIMAVLIGAGLLGYPGYLAYKGYRLPAIKDVTTDPIDPPRFEVVARLRPPNSSLYPGLATAELQKEAWPDIEPLLVNVTPKAAFDGAVAIITKRKWRIVDSRPPLANREGHIEAIARTPIMGFRDDVVVRVRPAREGAKIDIRSASRYGTTDFGANATRVLALLDDIDDAATPEKPERQERQNKSALKASAKPGQGGKR